MKTLTLATLLGLAALGPARADGIVLKPYTTLDSGTVRLSDLFEGADNRPLGPGPAPGGRINVDAPQLTAIARMFGLDWRPAGSGERAVLERPGRVLGKDDIMPTLRAVLIEAGASRDSDVELPMPSLAPLPTGTAPSFDYTALEFDVGSGRFTTLLHVALPGAPELDVRLSGRVQAMIELPVPRRAMVPGEVVTAADLQWTRMRSGLARGEVVREAAQAEGQSLRRPVQAGLPILLADLGRPVIVTKGQPLVLTLDGPGIALTAQGVANEPGGLGERIRVLNPYSRAVLEAEITGPGHARVLPGAGAGAARQVAER